MKSNKTITPTKKNSYNLNHLLYKKNFYLCLEKTHHSLLKT